MFALLKPKDPHSDAAESIYAACLLRTREAVFYEKMGVPDSFDGRFELLVLHVFLVLDRLKDEDRAFNQALFDVMFRDMDQTLRIMGIGDMGVSKRMKKMMQGFNGRVYAYEESVQSGDYKDALRRNLYGTVDGVAEDCLQVVERYIVGNREMLKSTDVAVILNGMIRFEDVK